MKNSIVIKENNSTRRNNTCKYYISNAAVSKYINIQYIK